MNPQYLDDKTLLTNIPLIDVKPTDLISADTYNETLILANYLKIDDVGKKLIYKAAIQLAIIGYGKKSYGSIRSDDDKVILLVDLFNKYNIKYNENLNSKYTDDMLSVRRLLRLFRIQIKNFIEKNGRPSYLWVKYANKDNLKYMSICFPGGEHIINTKDEGLFLINTYNNLDQQQKTKFVLRLKRVYIARGIFSPNELDDIK